MNPIIHAKEGKVQAQLIYPQKNVAALIANRLAKSKKVEYGVTKVATGFLVAPLAQPSPKTAAALCPPDKTYAKPLAEDHGIGASIADKFEITLPLKSIGDEWIHARHQGKAFWIAKSSLLAWSAPTPGSIVLVMTTAYGKKRGLLAA